MSEQRGKYFTPRPTTKPTIAYPGSRLETLVEALDTWAALNLETYPLWINGIHNELRCALEGETEPEMLLDYLMEAK